MDKVSKRVQEIETVNNNMKVLEEMMQHYQRGESNQAERDVMKVCYNYSGSLFAQTFSPEDS